jgi:aspartate aminotransferase
MQSPVALSLRSIYTPPSPIRKLAGLKRTAMAGGAKVFGLNIGQPDVKTPKEYFDGLKTYREDVLAYEDSEGSLALRIAWSDYMLRSSGSNTQAIKVAPENIMITTGASEALIFAFMTACDPADEVLIFDPTYANYMGFAAVTGVRLMPLLTEIENDFALPDTKTIESRISKRTKAILLCNPNNPTGTVYSHAEVKRLLDICNKNNLFFIVDETYRELVYDGLAPVSVLHLEADNPRVIVIDSLSKRFSLCGARLGCLITSNKEFYQKTLAIAQARLASPTLEQHAATEMLKNIKPDYFQAALKEYELRRNVLFNALQKIPQVKASKVQGAFYSVVALPVDNAENFAEYLLREFRDQGETVFVAPAAGFYMASGNGLNQVRIASVLEAQHLERAVEIIAKGLGNFKNH